MDKIKRSLPLLLLLMVSFASVAAESAAGLLARCAEKLVSAPSVSAAFSIRASDGEDIAGSIVMAPRLRMWFDGRTQWTALDASKEVNVTEPTADELLASNPFAIITGYGSKYNCRLLPSTEKNSVRRVELTPKKAGADIRRAVIAIDTHTLWPVKVTITMASGATVDAVVSSCTVGKKLSASEFVFNPSSLPGYEVVDLR